jgi:predicted glycosyltransferase
MDYEHQPFNHLCFRLARRVIVPEAFPDQYLRRYGAIKKAVKYHGLKEQVYLSDFSPTPNYLRAEDIPEQQVVIAMRPPAPWAPYHRFENTLFDDVLSSLAKQSQAFIIFLPRIPAQGEAVRRLGYSNVRVPPRTLDGPNLLYYADLVISGGGTMNREAAVLGTPVYTVFKGQLGAVDSYLIQHGRMMQISEPEDIAKIRVEKRNGYASSMFEPTLVEKVVDLILAGS